MSAYLLVVRVVRADYSTWLPDWLRLRMDKKIPCVQCYDGVVHPFFGRTVQLSGSLDSTSLAAAGIVDAKSKL